MKILFNIGPFVLSIVVGIVIWLFLRKKQFDIVIIRSMFYYNTPQKLDSKYKQKTNKFAV